MKPKALDETLYPHEWLLQSNFVFAIPGLAIGMILRMVFDAVPMEPTSGWGTTTYVEPDLFPTGEALLVALVLAIVIGTVLYFTDD